MHATYTCTHVCMHTNTHLSAVAPRSATSTSPLPTAQPAPNYPVRAFSPVPGARPALTVSVQAKMQMSSEAVCSSPSEHICVLHSDLIRADVMCTCFDNVHDMDPVLCMTCILRLGMMALDALMLGMIFGMRGSIFEVFCMRIHIRLKKMMCTQVPCKHLNQTHPH